MRTFRRILAACSAAGLLLIIPAATEAGPLADLLTGGCCGTARTTYSPPYVAPAYFAAAPAYVATAPACTSCVAQTAYYAPQTVYQAVYRPVVATAYQPMTYCDPCTGGAVTAYRPVVTWAPQVSYMPYTTYRVVYANPCVTCAPCNPCGSCGAVSYAAPAAGCSCGAAPVVSSSVVPYTTPSTGAGTPPVIEGGPTPKTFVPESKTESTSEKSLEPIPQAEGQSKTAPMNSSPGAPKLIDPENRTTLRAVPAASPYRLIAAPPRPVPVQSPVIDDGGWRASR
jgi:hypothetical protein